MILPVNEGAGGNLAIYSNLVIKVRPGTGKRFLESLQSQPTLASGNVFLKTPVNLEAKRKDVSAKHDTRFNLFVACMFFLLMIIFLGILGTFWFRIRQREGEIALRRVTGATRGDIFPPDSLREHAAPRHCNHSGHTPRCLVALQEYVAHERVAALHTGGVLDIRRADIPGDDAVHTARRMVPRLKGDEDSSCGSPEGRMIFHSLIL